MHHRGRRRSALADAPPEAEGPFVRRARSGTSKKGGGGSRPLFMFKRCAAEFLRNPLQVQVQAHAISEPDLSGQLHVIDIIRMEPYHLANRQISLPNCNIASTKGQNRRKAVTPSCGSKAFRGPGQPVRPRGRSVPVGLFAVFFFHFPGPGKSPSVVFLF